MKFGDLAIFAKVGWEILEIRLRYSYLAPVCILLGCDKLQTGASLRLRFPRRARPPAPPAETGHGHPARASRTGSAPHTGHTPGTGIFCACYALPAGRTAAPATTLRPRHRTPGARRGRPARPRWHQAGRTAQPGTGGPRHVRRARHIARQPGHVIADAIRWRRPTCPTQVSARPRHVRDP